MNKNKIMKNGKILSANLNYLGKAGILSKEEISLLANSFLLYMRTNQEEELKKQIGKILLPKKEYLVVKETINLFEN